MANSTNATDTISSSALPTSIFFSALNIVLSITASLGNTLILMALYKVSSIHPPTKWLFGSLAVTDLCVGLISQPLYAILLLVDFTDMDDIFTFFLVSAFFFSMLFVVSVLTSTAISVDRLLALLLRMRYRQVVTLRRVRVVVGCVWLFAVLYGALYTTMWDLSLDDGGIESFFCWTFFGVIILSIVMSMFCYTKIIFTLHLQQAQMQDHVQPGQLNRGRNPLNMAGLYKKTVLCIALVQIALLTCYAPYTMLNLTLWYGNIDFSTVMSVTFEFAVCLLYLNSSLNLILYCWGIRDVRQEVKNILRKCAPC